MPRSSSAISLDTSSRTSVSASATRSSAPRSCAPTCFQEACVRSCTCAVGDLGLQTSVTHAGMHRAGEEVRGRLPGWTFPQQPCTLKPYIVHAHFKGMDSAPPRTAAPPRRAARAPCPPAPRAGPPTPPACPARPARPRGTRPARRRLARLAPQRARQFAPVWQSAEVMDCGNKAAVIGCIVKHVTQAMSHCTEKQSRYDHMSARTVNA